MQSGEDDELCAELGAQGGVTRRRFSFLVSKAAAGAVGIVGGLVSFAPGRAAFATLAVPNGACEPLAFTGGYDCTAACDTQSSCCQTVNVGGVIVGEGSDYVCCKSDALNIKVAQMQMVFRTLEPGTSPPESVAWACCIPCF